MNPNPTERNTDNKVKMLATAAMFAAIITLVTVIIRIPIGSSGGYLNFGDAFAYLAASILPFPYAAAAAGIGAGLADLFSGGAIWILPTIIIKPLMVIPFTMKNKKILNRQNYIALAVGGLICLAGYYVAEAIIVGNWTAPLLSLGGGAIQSAGSAVLYVLAGLLLDKLNAKQMIM